MKKLAVLLVLGIGFSVLAPALHAADEVATDSKGDLEKPVNLWPLVYQRKTAGTYELELLFSLFAYERDQRKTTLAVRPFYWKLKDPAEETVHLSILWPLSDYKRVKGESRLWILPLFWRRANAEMSKSVLFPFFSHKRTGSKTRLGVIGYTPFTLFDFQKDREADTVRNRYILWTYEREKTASHASFLPFYESTRDVGLKSVSVIPLFAYYRDRKKDAFRVSAIGFPDTWNLFEYRRRGTDYKEWHFIPVYRLRAKEAYRLVVFPIYWDLRRGDDFTFHVWPLYSDIKKGTSREHGTVWPLFRYRTDPAEGEKDLKLFWPLFREASGPGGFRNHRAFPLYALHHDPDTKDRPKWLLPGLISPLPLLYRADGDGFLYGRFFWLAWWCDTEKKKNEFVLNYYSVQDKDSGNRHRGLFPVWHTSTWDDRRIDYVFPTFVNYSDAGLTARTFFPLYWHYRTPETSWGAFVPLYFRYHSEPLTFKTFFPFYWYTKNTAEDSEFSYFFPVYGRYRRGATAQSHLLFFPLFARFHDPESHYRSWDVAWPLVHRDVSPDGGSVRVLPFYWSSKHKDTSFRMGFPLYWEFHSPASSQLHVLPFYGHYRTAEGFSLTYGLGPLYVRLKDEKEDTDRRSYFAFLAGRVRDREETRSYVFPLFWSKKSPEESRLFLLPLYGRETAGPSTTHFFLGFMKDWALFQHTGDPTTGYGQTRAILYQSKNDGGGWSRTFFPLYWTWGGDQTTFRMLFPLWAWQTDKAEGKKELSLIGLHDGLSLFHFRRDAVLQRRLDRVLIFSRDTRPERTRTVAFPLFWRTVEKDRRRTVFFPFYNHGDDETGKDRTGVLGFTPVFSLFSTRHDRDVHTNRLWPLYGYRRRLPADRELGLIGVWYPASILHWRWAPELYEHHLFPLYAYDRKGAKDSPERSVHASVLWQVVSYDRKGTRDRDFRFLWRLVKVTRKGGDRSVEVNPFYFKISKEGKGSYWAVLGGLLGREHLADGTTKTRILWLINL